MIDLQGAKVAFLTANEGVEQVELTDPWEAIRSSGGTPVLLAPEPGSVQAFNHLTSAEKFLVDKPVADASASDYAALVLPGGVANPDQLRQDPNALRFITEFSALGRPIAAICHAPWSLISASLVKGRRMTSWPSLRDDLTNAGALWEDSALCVDTDGPFTLITSRKPDDLPSFSREVVERVAEYSSNRVH